MNDPDREGWITYTDRASDHLCPIPSHLSDWIDSVKNKIKLGQKSETCTHRKLSELEFQDTQEKKVQVSLSTWFKFTFYLAVFTESSSFLYAKLLDFV